MVSKSNGMYICNQCQLEVTTIQGFFFLCIFFLIAATKKKTEVAGTGGGPPPASFTPAEELALEINKGRPVLEGIEGGTSSKMISRSIRSEYIKGVCVLLALFLPD